METTMEIPLEVEGLKDKMDALFVSKPEKLEGQVQNEPETQLATHKNEETISPATEKVVLPTEIWKQILGNLPTKDVKNFRLACNRFANVGSEQFIRKFDFHAYKPDIEKLETISREHPRSLINVREVRFETGFVALRTMYDYIHHVYRQELNWDGKGRYLLKGKKKVEPSVVSDLMSEYLNWYKNWHNSAQEYNNIEKMTEAFKNLKVVTYIHFSNSCPQFKSQALIRAWNTICNKTKGFRVAFKINEFETIMRAVHDANVRVQRLDHDSMPVEFFTRDFDTFAKVLKSFSGLENLKLLCEGKFKSYRLPDVDHDKCTVFWTGLWKSVQLAPNLKTLHIGMKSTTRDGQHNYWNDYNQVFVPLRNVLGEFTWPSLNRLRLDGMTLNEDDLTALLLRHASSLRHLTLSNVTLFQGTYHGLLRSVRKGLKLESFRLDGRIRSYHHRLENYWRFMPQGNDVANSFGPLDNMRCIRCGRSRCEICEEPQNMVWDKDLVRLLGTLRHELTKYALNQCPAEDWPSKTLKKVASYDRPDFLPFITPHPYTWDSDLLVDFMWRHQLRRGLEKLTEGGVKTWMTKNLPESKYWLKSDSPATFLRDWELWDKMLKESGVSELYDRNSETEKSSGSGATKSREE